MNDIQQAKLNGCPEHNDYHADCSRCREKHGASAGREEPIAHDPLIVELVDMAERMEYSGQIKPATLLYAVRNEITNLRSALDQCLTAATHSDISDAEARDVVKTIASVALARALAADRETTCPRCGSATFVHRGTRRHCQNPDCPFIGTADTENKT